MSVCVYILSDFFFDISAQEGGGGFELVTSTLIIRGDPNQLSYLLGTYIMPDEDDPANP
jgi:hypothetical protein